MSRLATFTVSLLVRPLEEGLFVGEALFFPEVSRLATSREHLRDGLRETLAGWLPDLPPRLLHARHAPSPVEVASVILPLAPAGERGTWREPLALRFDVVHFPSAGQEAAIACVPALGIEVVAGDRKHVDEILPGEILAELMRRRATLSLPALVMLQRDRGLEVETVSLEVALPSPKERALHRLQAPERKRILPLVARELHARSLPPVYEVDPTPLARALRAPAGRSVLLVGPSGAGKTALLHQLARTRASHGMAGTTFWETSGARLMAGGTGLGAWQERCQDMWREARGSRSILSLGNLVELAEVGRHESSPEGVAGFLVPFLARDEVPVVAECTPEQRSLLERQHPRLLQCFRSLPVEPPSAETTLAILTQAAQEATHGTATTVEAEAIATVARLHHRFATSSSPPGRSLRFARHLIHEAADRHQPRVTARDVAAAFGHETGLPTFLIDPGVPLDVEETRAWFSRRLLGQPEPVDLVVDALATVKASLTRPRRPVGSFLFIGPTGVGKTEMARCLAEFLFRDRNRLVRFDMSEYADPAAVQRLVGTAGATEGLLTAAIREQPFCVLLLDEVEKAHPWFFDLLLQVLGEARLTDAAGRLADFRNVVIVMTSNLGASSHPRATLGFVSSAERGQSPREVARQHFVSAVRAHLRPELFNRIDRIVPFAPLDEESVLQLAERELENLQRRDGILYREVSLEVEEGVAAHLAARGFDPRYGARPLKRAVEREVLAPLATGLNRYGDDVPLRARVRLEDHQLHVDVRPRQGPDAQVRRRDARLLGLVSRLGDARTRAQRLLHCPAALELQSDLFRLEQPRRRWRSPEETGRDEERRQHLRAAWTEAEAVASDLAAAEDHAMLALLARGALDPAAMAQSTQVLEHRLHEVATDVLASAHPSPRMVIALHATAIPMTLALGRIYLGRLSRWQEPCRVMAIVTRREKDGDGSLMDEPQADPRDERDWSRVLLQDPAAFLAQERGDLLGLALELASPRAMALLETEAGMHVVVHERQGPQRCHVAVETLSLDDYRPPHRIDRHRSLDTEARRRTISPHEGTIDDAVVGRSQHRDLTLEDAVNACLDGTLERRLAEMLEGAPRA